ncbi:hypothetical protein GGF43_002356 [Coemansia sp. RSA 2618]|nr:hypothetical protein GGF43_002356 [Coemansia sp. RSA 2618]
MSPSDDQDTTGAVPMVIDSTSPEKITAIAIGEAIPDTPTPNVDSKPSVEPAVAELDSCSLQAQLKVAEHSQN